MYIALKKDIFFILTFFIFLLSQQTLANDQPILFSGSYKPTLQSDDYPADVIIRGTSCEDLYGLVYPPEGKTTIYRGKFYCFPYQKNLAFKLKNTKISYVDHSDIKFENGLFLFPSELRVNVSKAKSSAPKQKQDFKMIPESAGYRLRQFKVRDIYPCKKNSQANFCASLDMDYLEGLRHFENYAIYCWDCKEIQASAEALQKSIIFYREKNGIHLAFSGGYGVPEQNIKAFEKWLLGQSNFNKEINNGQ